MEDQILEVAESLPSIPDILQQVQIISMLLYTVYNTNSSCTPLTLRLCKIYRRTNKGPAISAFCQWISQQPAESPVFTAKVLYTEKSCSTRTGTTNIHHKHVWSDKMFITSSKESDPPPRGLECYVTALEALTIYRYR
jgi:hypothetical protein